MALPISMGFYNWRNLEQDNVMFIKKIVNRPIEDVDELAEEVYWCDDWGKEPTNEMDIDRTGEIKKLYLNGNFYVIAVGAFICIPLAKKVMDMIYPVMVENVGCAMDIQFSAGLYGIIYAGVIIVYLVINQLLVGRLNKVNLAEVLKNRE